jgi:hypothetical protein
MVPSAIQPPVADGAYKFTWQTICLLNSLFVGAK